MSDGLTPLSEVREYLWRKGELSFLLHDTQKEIDQTVSEANSGEILVFSSRQLGKSYWAVVHAIAHCIKNPGSIVRICASTLKQVQDIVNDNIAPIMRSAPHDLIERQKSSYRWRIGDSSLRLGPLERAYVDYNRGGNAALIICEEGGFVPSDDYEYAIRSVLGPQLLRSGGSLIHVTTPSEDPLHYIHTEVLPKTKMSGACFRYTIYDNPQLTPEQIEKAKELCGGEETAAWKREYLAEIHRDPKSMVVPTFSPDRHVKEFLLPTHSRWHTSIDLGGVRDKTVGILYTYDFLRNKMLIRAEFACIPNTPSLEIVKAARVMECTVGEVAGRWMDAPGQIQIDYNHAHKFETRLPIKDDWKAGINNMQVMFALDQIEIHPECKFLIASLESGQFNKLKTDFARTEFLGHCDALAALNYALRMVDRENPYPGLYAPQNVYVVNKRDSNANLQTAIQPKVFKSSFNGQESKRFGNFKKR